ncbi:nucleoporin NUP37 [Diplogelasinospora grovesii]|uniref:Nucleoporin NUP37 n=1 Tax=Diplogelasinospora grovesii TaxID=303347 RepID=A0AAN6MXG5_9PEZI|nr:nucleoporin NUP37 [Diplogelasinospora grovesii]
MPLAPRTRRTAQNTQYTYPLNCRIYDVKPYPVQSPQGAAILIYGHENGLTLVWRGGKRLKAAKKAGKEKTNGGGNAAADAVMVIDSDDEAQPASSTEFTDKPEFEDEPATSDPPEIVQTLDLALGTAALHVAVLPMAPCKHEDAAWSGAEILKDKMVFAVSCATNDICVVTLPLTPPSHESKARPELRQNLLAANAGKGVWGETLTLLGGQSRHCDGIAITLVKKRSGERSRSSERIQQASTASRAIVAAHSREASGTLRFWDVSLDAKPGAAARVEPFQTEYLPTPLARISFNPSHTTQLLTIAPAQAVRVYDYSIPSLPSDDTSEGPFPTQGSWLLSLYPPFTRGTPMSTARKPIVAAEWISHGRAVLTLLADGQWGIWDIEGASPSISNASGGLFSKATAGLRGSAITAFSVSGHLEGTSPLRNPGTQKGPAAPGSGAEFVPMTPHTRKEALTTSVVGGSERLAAVRGGIHVTQIGTGRGSSAASASDESAVLWLGGADPIVAVVPVISRFWDSQLRRAVGGGVNLWSGAQPTRMIRLTDLSVGLLGERCTGAIALPRSKTRPTSNGSAPAGEGGDAGSAEGLPVEVLLQGESRIVIVHESEEDSGTSFTNRLLGAARKKSRTDLQSAAPKAILAYPRPEKPNSVAFNLSISRAGMLRRPSARGLFDNNDDTAMDVHQSIEGPDDSQVAPSRKTGLLFANDLLVAADVPDDEAEAENRDIEQEMMDIMEIDRELEQLEQDRDRGTKHVFFEEV